MTRDNKITNKMVRQGKLPKNQMETFKQKKSPRKLKTKQKMQIQRKVQPLKVKKTMPMKASKAGALVGAMMGAKRALPAKKAKSGMQLLSKAMKVKKK